MKPSRSIVIGFWISTVLFWLQIGFTAYAQLSLPAPSRLKAWAHAGFAFTLASAAAHVHHPLQTVVSWAQQ